MGHPIHERKNTAELPLERANRAINYVMQGKNVSIISSGDSGIYGMAGIVFSIPKYDILYYNSGALSYIFHRCMCWNSLLLPV